MNLPKYHHRMSSSELERILYITNSDTYHLYFKRDEPFPNIENHISDYKELEDTTETTKLVKETVSYLKLKSDLHIHLDIESELNRRIRSLYKEISLLCKEMEYVGGSEEEIRKHYKPFLTLNKDCE